MGVTGKYDFSGIQRFGVKALKIALASTVWGAWLIKSPFIIVIEYAAELLINYLANRGLIILNIGAIYFNGEVDQSRLDQAIESGLERVRLAGGKLSEREIKEIDDAVVRAADTALPYPIVDSSDSHGMRDI